MAEYERAKILERSRRGKRHAADSGSVNALSGAPYGYHYIDKHSGGGQARPRLRPGRGQSPQPRRPYSTYPVATEEWIGIPVPALVDEALFESVGQQLSENRRRARQNQRGAKYLLQGLVVCKQCGYSYYGKPVSNKAAKGKTRDYAYYRCIGTDAYRFAGQRICSNTQVRTDLLEVAVWREVRALLENPQRRFAGVSPSSATAYQR